MQDALTPAEIATLLGTKILDRLWEEIEKIETASDLTAFRHRLSGLAIRDEAAEDARMLAMAYGALRDLESAACDAIGLRPGISLISLSQFAAHAASEETAQRIREALERAQARMDRKWKARSRSGEPEITSAKAVEVVA